MPDFDELIAEGESVPTDGWDFSWFDGRATEQRPTWGYAGLAADRAASAAGMLDVQTGGGEVYAEILDRADPRPPVVAATEGWHPNVAIARAALERFDGIVVESPEDAALPYADETFELVVSRHPVVTDFAEIARVLAPGGTYLSQQIGERSNSELYEFLMGPQARNPVARIDTLSAAAKAAGLDLLDAREERTRIEFFDLAAVVHFLRKVVWTVPDFEVDRYRDRLRAVHDVIEREGVFVSFSSRILLEARRQQ